MLIVVLIQCANLMAADQAGPLLPPSFQARPHQAAQVFDLSPLGPDELEFLDQRTRGPAATGIVRLFPSDGLEGRFEAASGHWFEGSSGPVWRMAVVSPQSTRTRLQFKGVELGEGKVWVHDGKNQSHGPYTGPGRFGDGEFWSHSVRGERIVVEWQPEHLSQAGEPAPFSIARVSHSWAAEPLPERPTGGLATGKDDLERVELEPRRSAIPRHWTEDGDAKEAPRPLLMGQPSGFKLPESSVPTLHSGARSFGVRVPDGADSIRIEVRVSEPTAQVFLYLRRGRASEVQGGTVIADWASEGFAGPVAITIDGDSNPPLRGGEWRVSLGSLGGASGNIVVTPRFSGHICYRELLCEQEWVGPGSAVALIEVVKGGGAVVQCSGALINTDLTENRRKVPFFLTAAHCVESAHEARTLEAHWYYQRSGCGTGGLDSRYEATIGAELLAFENGALMPTGKVSPRGRGDISLLKLVEAPPSSTWRLGWTSAIKAYGTNVVGIHHPNGESKKISFGEIEPPVSAGPGFYEVEWGTGFAFKGASGSPLIASHEGGWRVVGVLSYGNDDHEGCFDKGSPVGYSRLSAFYPQIREILDGTRIGSISRKGPWGMEFEQVPSGQFRMGSDSTAAYEDEQPVRSVRVRRGFEIGKHEVTQAQWRYVMGDNPSYHLDCGGECPVERVSWHDAQEFVQRLNAIGDGYVYRLPSEAEWEYAARAGAIAERYGPVDDIAWHWGNSGYVTREVGLKRPNAWGLHDMLGNVHEWVQDCSHTSYEGAPSDERPREDGPCNTRVFRGLSWATSPETVRVTYRGARHPGDRIEFNGLRVVRVPSGRGASLAPWGMEFAHLPPGRFVMGSANDTGPSEKPVRTVRVRAGFELAKHEVTQGQWNAIMGDNPAYFESCGQDCPVERVSWDDTQEFLERLNALGDGYRYRLPTEAEWEYAARGGTTGDLYGPASDIAWHWENSWSGPNPVGTKTPNAFGLYDMIGNVEEWVQDCWYASYEGASNDERARTGRDGCWHVFRGGSWWSTPANLRVTRRMGYISGSRDTAIGVRIARTPVN
ncbi:MAG: SUMF1/EgtB/PvdO family nonheme iron enzyme [Bryobacterales bacterium]|nr:SUMF1/EgtB/PvdO family nonheme iron enzyme [Bryobacterales bacterium]